jgi:molybdopterin-binding protein
MILKINLKEDAELRGEIKDLIRGQVKSLLSEEVNSVIANEIKEQTIKYLKGHLGTIVVGKVNNMIDKNFTYFASEQLNDGIVRDAILSSLTKKINEWCNTNNFQKLVDVAVKAKISKMIE